MSYKLKQFFIFFIIIILVFFIFWNYYSNKENKKINQLSNKPLEEIESPEIISACYYENKKTDRNFYDVFWLKINVKDNNVTGEYQSLPAEKDSKVGNFTGVISPEIKDEISKTANVWWNSLAEGMEVTEELLISFDEDKASILMGDMYDRGDGVYIYRDKNQIRYKQNMQIVDCLWLDEKIEVEKYLLKNISKIAVNEPVLGGTWYVLSVYVNPTTKTGEVLYEDGHIQSEGIFNYSYDAKTKMINISNFEVIK